MHSLNFVVNTLSQICFYNYDMHWAEICIWGVQILTNLSNCYILPRQIADNLNVKSFGRFEIVENSWTLSILDIRVHVAMEIPQPEIYFCRCFPSMNKSSCGQKWSSEESSARDLGGGLMLIIILMLVWTTQPVPKQTESQRSCSNSTWNWETSYWDFVWTKRCGI